MRGLVRFLIMFGPMIFRQIQKYQRNQQRKQRHDPYPENRNISNDSSKENQATRKQEILSEEERNFRMKEEEFMLDKEVQNNTEEMELNIEEYLSEKNQEFDTNSKQIKEEQKESPISQNKPFNIRDLFVKEVED